MGGIAVGRTLLGGTEVGTTGTVVGGGTVRDSVIVGCGVVVGGTRVGWAVTSATVGWVVSVAACVAGFVGTPPADLLVPMAGGLCSVA